MIHNESSCDEVCVIFSYPLTTEELSLSHDFFEHCRELRLLFPSKIR